MKHRNLTFETEQEDSGLWLAEIPKIAGVMAYGVTKYEATINALSLAERVIAELLQNGEVNPNNLTSPPVSPMSLSIPSDAQTIWRHFMR
jgi:predicted RNase H-like HicB family nuclease